MKMPKLFTRASNFLNKREAAYPAAGQGILNLGWGNSSAGPNTVLNNNLASLRRRSRQEVRSNTWAASAVDAVVTNTIGSGIRPMSDNEELLNQFDQWSDECDAHSYTNFYGIQSLVMRSVVESGECFIRFRPRRVEDNLSIPVQLEVLESEMIPVSKNEILQNGNEIIAGVEFNKIGKIVAYHIHKKHPGETYGVSIADTDLVRVRSERIMHVRLVNRPGAVRGEPWLSRALITLKDLNEFTEAQLVKQKVSALFGGFITTPGGDDDNEVVSGIAPQIHPDDEGVAIDPIEPGSWSVLPEGFDVKFANPPDAGSGFESFLQTNLRAIAASVGITYSQLTGDFNGVNDRIIRASLLEFKRRARMWQNQMIIQQLCKPVFKKFIEIGQLSGVIKNEALSVKWIPEAWEYLNPVQEIGALEAEVKAGFKSRSEVIRSRSKDPANIDLEIFEDNKRADELGLSHTSDARFTNGKQVDTDQDDTN